VPFARVVARAGEPEAQRVASVDPLETAADGDVESAATTGDPDDQLLDDADEFAADGFVALARWSRRQHRRDSGERLQVLVRGKQDR